MWLIYMLIYYTEQFGKFLVEIFYAMLQYTIFYFFASVTENPEDIDKHQWSIKHHGHMQASRDLKNAKENN